MCRYVLCACSVVVNQQCVSTKASKAQTAGLPTQLHVHQTTKKRDAMCWKLEKIGIKIQTAPRLLTVAGLNCRTKVSSATFGRTMGGSIVSVAAVWDGIWGAQVASCVARCGGWWCECGLENCKIRPFLFLVCASSGGAPRFCFSFFQHIL